MDSIDNEIIRILSDDSRTPNTEIAKKLELSEGAVRRRINRLIETGVIRKFSISLGEVASVTAFASIILEKNARAQQVIADLKKMPEITNIYETSGQIDLLIECACENNEKLNSLVDNINLLDGVSKTLTQIVLKRI